MGHLRRDPQNHVAVALAGTAHGPETVCSVHGHGFFCQGRRQVGGPRFGLSNMQIMPPMPSLLHENGIGIGIGIGIGDGGRGADVKVACDFAKLQMRCVFLNPQSPIMSAGELIGTLRLHCFNERDKGPCVISGLGIVGM